MTNGADPRAMQQRAPAIEFFDGAPLALADQVMALGRHRTELFGEPWASSSRRCLYYGERGLMFATDDDVRDGVAAVIGGMRALGEEFDGTDLSHFLSSGVALKSLLKALHLREPLPMEAAVLSVLARRLCRSETDPVQEAIFVQDFFAVPRHWLFDQSLCVPQRPPAAAASANGAQPQ